MRVTVYVEGPSDIKAMTELLKPLVSLKAQEGIVVRFIAEGIGDAKKALLLKTPTKAAKILLNDPQALVVAMPDLYPKNKGFPHNNPYELVSGILRNFESALPKKLFKDQRIKKRFRVFCFKHDLEALLLAADDSLKAHLGISRFKIKWTKPVEDQDFNAPPRKVVEKIFAAENKVYNGPFDAPLILNKADYHDIADRCPQCFKPFVDFLEKLPDIS